MSAYIVTKKHIQYLVAAMFARRIVRNYGFSWWDGSDRKQLRAGDIDLAAEIGTLLWRENVKSVNSRYRDTTDLDAYTLTANDICLSDWIDFDPVQVIKSCHCLTYQSCEHSGWETSTAKQIVDALVDSCTRALVGYDAATWGEPQTYAEKAQSLRRDMAAARN